MRPVQPLIRLATTAFLWLLCLNPTLQAGGRGVDNGGDFVASEFTAVGHKLVTTLAAGQWRDKKVGPEVASGVRQAVQTVRIVSLPGPLVSNLGIIVDARVMQYGSELVIELDRGTWERFLFLGYDVERLVLHEYLRVAGFDDNFYAISAQASGTDRIDAVTIPRENSFVPFCARPPKTSHYYTLYKLFAAVPSCNIKEPTAVYASPESAFAACECVFRNLSRQKELKLQNIADPEPLRYLTWLRKLEFSVSAAGQPTSYSWDVTPLVSLRDLRSLSFTGYMPLNLQALGRLPRLSYLKIHGTTLVGLNGVYLPALTGLDLANNHVNLRQRQLVRAPLLESLNLADNDINNVALLNSADFPRLKRLTLSQNDLSESGFSSLRTFTALESLDLTASRLERFSLATLPPSLTSLNLSANPLTTVSITGFTGHLAELNLSQTKWQDASLLASPVFDSLLNLNVAGIERFDPATVPDLPQLVALDVSDIGHNLSLPDMLRHVPNLRSLRMSGLGITDLSMLNAVDSLTHLDMANNNLTEVEPLASQTRLVSLDLSGNLKLTLGSALSTFTRLAPLRHLNNLETLKIGPAPDTLKAWLVDRRYAEQNFYPQTTPHRNDAGKICSLDITIVPNPN